MEGLPKRQEERKGGLNRRSFLKGMGAAGIGMQAGIGILEGEHLYQRRSLLMKMLQGAEKPGPILEAATKYFKDTYGIDLYVGDRWENERSISDEPARQDVNEAIQCLVDEFGKYPPDFFKENQIKALQIGKNLRVGRFFFNRTDAAGYAEGKIRHIGISVRPGDAVSLRGTIHHEIHHVLDFWSGREATDVEWGRIHQECSCRATDTDMKDLDPRAIRNRAYISVYGETSSVEERAVFAAFMMVPHQHQQLLRRIDSEGEPARTTLRRKYNVIRGQYLLWSKGKMDDAYWDGVLARADSDPRDPSNETRDGYYDAGYIGFGDYGYAPADTYTYEAVEEGISDPRTRK